MESVEPNEPRWYITELVETDADELGRVHVRTWQEAYAESMDAEYLANLDPAQRAENWRRRAQGAPEPDAVTLVARDGADGPIVGFISVGPARDEDPVTPYELRAINIVSEVYGTGLADELVQRALGARAAYLWVVQNNHRAQAFYRRHGFVDDGGRSMHEATEAPEIRMSRA